MAVFDGSNKVYDRDSKDSQGRHMLDVAGAVPLLQLTEDRAGNLAG